MSHFEQRMETDLERIREWVWHLGLKVEKALDNATRALVIRDEDECYATVLADHAINRDSLHCDRLCHTFIARHLPGAGHLREMAATIRVNVALERLGDYAVTICRGALQLGGPLPAPLAGYMDPLADESMNILQQSRVAFRKGDAERATELIHSAQQVEGRMDHIYDLLAATDDQLDGRSMMSIYAVFSLYKRVADQAKNICDQTLYAAEGIAKVSKRHKTLFLDRPGSGIGLMATAIGRKYYSHIGAFNAAVSGQTDTVSEEVEAFLQTRGFSDTKLRSKQLEAMQFDVGKYNLIVCVNGDYHDYLSKIPFHSSALNWDIEGTGPNPDLTVQYRSLRSEIDDLVALVAGEHARED